MRNRRRQICDSDITSVLERSDASFTKKAEGTQNGPGKIALARAERFVVELTFVTQSNGG